MRELANQRRAHGGLRELALFAGAGGGILAGKLLGWQTICAVEKDPFAASVLLARQNDGSLEAFPVWDDVCTFEGRPWRGIVDVVSGGFPCQDISAAGRGAGIEGERSGLWTEFARIIREVRPRYVFVENSPILTSRGLGVVLGDLAALGFDARWGVLGAADVGAPHQRDRIWIVANARSGRRGKPEGREVELKRRAEVECAGDVSNANGDTLCAVVRDPNEATDADSEGQSNGERCATIAEFARDGTAGNRRSGVREKDQWKIEPNVGRMVDGVASGMDRIRCLGNGQVPQCAAEAWRMLSDDT